jgi:hypothetical protein
MNCVLVNQLATPGLGSIMAGRRLVGAGQLALALLGFLLFLVWFGKLLVGVWSLSQADSPAPAPSSSIAEWGRSAAALFLLAWLWALATSISLLREAREHS